MYYQMPNSQDINYNFNSTNNNLANYGNMNLPQNDGADDDMTREEMDKVLLECAVPGKEELNKKSKKGKSRQIVEIVSQLDGNDDDEESEDDQEDGGDSDINSLLDDGSDDENLELTDHLILWYFNTN